MAIAYASSSVSAWATGTNPAVVTKPSGLAVGDLMLLQYHEMGGNPPDFASDGWNQIQEQNEHAVYWKLATSGDVAASTFSFTPSISTNGTAAGILRFTETAYGAPDSGKASFTTTTSVSQSITLVQKYVDSLIVFFLSARGDNPTVSAYAINTDNPSPWNEVYDTNTANGAQGAISAAYAARAQATDIQGASCTLSAAAAGSVVMVSIRPIQTLSITEVQATSETYSYVTGYTVNVVESVALSETVEVRTSKYKNVDKSSSAGWVNTDKND